ncbi:MAG: HEPN domain-containing protein [Nitrospirae bacterium]|nr:HEPN domain-containing protein [Nitrospirota bacterium]
MNDEIHHLVKYRLEQAEDCLKEASLLKKEGMSNRAILNRLYYALFYSIIALLQTKQMGTSKHAGAISMFDKEFIKTNAFDKSMSKTLHRVFELRQKGDYMEYGAIPDQDVEDLLPKVADFVISVKRYFSMETMK